MLLFVYLVCQVFILATNCQAVLKTFMPMYQIKYIEIHTKDQQIYTDSRIATHSNFFKTSFNSQRKHKISGLGDLCIFAARRDLFYLGNLNNQLNLYSKSIQILYLYQKTQFFLLFWFPNKKQHVFKWEFKLFLNQRRIWNQGLIRSEW